MYYLKVFKIKALHFEGISGHPTAVLRIKINSAESPVLWASLWSSG